MAYADDMPKMQELYSGQRLTVLKPLMSVAGSNGYFPAQRLLTEFCNRVGGYLLCSKNWNLKHNSNYTRSQDDQTDCPRQRDFGVELTAVTFTTVQLTKLSLWQKLSAMRHNLLYKVWK